MSVKVEKFQNKDILICLSRMRPCVESIHNISMICSLLFFFLPDLYNFRDFSQVRKGSFLLTEVKQEFCEVFIQAQFLSHQYFSGIS